MKKIIYLDKPTEYANALIIEVYYDKGGRNYFTCKDERRGYYLYVCPVLRSDGLVSYTSFSGTKLLLKEVARKSAKAEAEAEEIAKGKVADLVASVCNRNGIAIPNEIA